MALVAFASNRSPGLTTTVLALAATWPAPRRVVVAELDPDGGTIAARQILAHDPGLISLAASGSRGLKPELIMACVQQLANGTLALLAPPGPDRVTASLDALGPAGLDRQLGELPGLDVLADCGRVDRRSPALRYLRGADAVIFVVRSSIEDVVGLKHRLQTLDLGPVACGIVVVGRRPYPPEEIAQACTVPVLGVIDHDPRAATALGNGNSPERSRLMRSAAVLARHLPGLLPAPTVVHAPDQAGVVPQGSRLRAPSSLPPTSPSGLTA